MWKKWKLNRVASAILKAARWLAKWVEKVDLDKEDINLIYGKIVELSDPENTQKPLDKFSEVATWAADKFFSANVSRTVTTIVQVIYYVAKIKGDLKNK